MVASLASKAQPVPGSLQDVVGAAAADGAEIAYAGFVTRTIAIVLDTLIVVLAGLAVAAAVLLVFAVFAIRSKHHALVIVLGGLAFAIWAICYFAGFWTTTGQTPGNRVMHIRVVQADGARTRPRQALIRLGAMVLSLPLFWGYLPILVSTRRRGVPDVLAGTVVAVVDDLGQPDQFPRP